MWRHAVTHIVYWELLLKVCAHNGSQSFTKFHINPYKILPRQLILFYFITNDSRGFWGLILFHITMGMWCRLPLCCSSNYLRSIISRISWKYRLMNPCCKWKYFHFICDKWRVIGLMQDTFIFVFHVNLHIYKFANWEIFFIHISDGKQKDIYKLARIKFWLTFLLPK